MIIEYTLHLDRDILYLLNQTRNHNKGGDNMTDSEKLDMLLSEMQGMKSEKQNVNIRINNLESQLKQTERVLKDEIRKECSLVLVHSIL